MAAYRHQAQHTDVVNDIAGSHGGGVEGREAGEGRVRGGGDSLRASHAATALPQRMLWLTHIRRLQLFIPTTL